MNIDQNQEIDEVNNYDERKNKYIAHQGNGKEEF